MITGTTVSAQCRTNHLWPFQTLFRSSLAFLMTFHHARLVAASQAQHAAGEHVNVVHAGTQNNDKTAVFVGILDT